jgi:hypothetical protein
MKKAIVALCTLGLASVVMASSTPCRDDAKKICEGKKGRDEIKACLIENKDKVSAACKAKLEEAEKKPK